MGLVKLYTTSGLGELWSILFAPHFAIVTSRTAENRVISFARSGTTLTETNHVARGSLEPLPIIGGPSTNPAGFIYQATAKQIQVWPILNQTTGEIGAKLEPVAEGAWQDQQSPAILFHRLYVTDETNNPDHVNLWTPGESGQVTAGQAFAPAAEERNLRGITSAKGHLYVCSTKPTNNLYVLAVNESTGEMSLAETRTIGHQTTARSNTPVIASPDENNLYAISGTAGGGTIYQFKLESSGLLAPLSPATVSMTGVIEFAYNLCVHPNGKTVYVGGEHEGKAAVAELPRGAEGKLGTPVVVSTGEAGKVIGLAISPDGELLVTVNPSGTMTVFQAEAKPSLLGMMV